MNEFNLDCCKYWEKIIDKWEWFFTSQNRSILIKNIKESLIIPTDQIQTKALQYYERWKKGLNAKLEVVNDEKSYLQKTYLKIRQDFHLINGNYIQAHIRYNELIYDDIGLSTMQVLQSVKNLDGSVSKLNDPTRNGIMFDINDIGPEMKFNQHETLSCVLGKAYYCSYLFKIITDNNSHNQEVNKFCESMNIEIPKNHFRVLTTSSSQNGNPYLSEDQFNDFIKRAFLGKKETDKIELFIKPNNKLKVQYLFYDFYKLCKKEYCEYEKAIFVKLLTDNFTNFKYKSVFENFNHKPSIPLKRVEKKNN